MEPITRSEQYLASIIGEDVVLPVPQSRIEHYLNLIAQNGISPSSAGLISYDPDADYPDGSLGAGMKAEAAEVADLKSAFDELKPVVPEPCIVNMMEFFWANGAITLSSQVTSDENVDTLYLLVSGDEGDTTLTVDESSPLQIADIRTGYMMGIIEYNDDSLDMVSLAVVNGEITVYPALKTGITLAKIWSLSNGIHLSSAGYRYFTDCFFSMNRKYTRKSKALKQYNPYDWENSGTNPLTKIGTYWWGKGTANTVSSASRVVQSFTKDYLNASFATGATAQSPKGFEWQENLDGKSGYFEMLLAARDNTQANADLADGYEMTVEWYLDGVLTETYVKKSKRIEAIRFDFSGAQTGKVKLYVTAGVSNYEAHVSQITWWLTDETAGSIFEDYKVPCLLMDSWGVYHDNAVATELASLLTANGMLGYVVNNSSGSKTSAWGVENFYTLVWAEHPAYMITDFQLNDINTGVSKADFIANMKNLINASVANGIIPIILLQGFSTSSGNYTIYSLPMITALTELPT